MSEMKVDKVEMSRSASPAELLLDAAENLAAALVRVRALTTSYTALTLDIVNDALERAGVHIVEGKR